MPEANSEPAQTSAASLTRGAPWVLLADDDEDLRATLRELLAGLGYVVSQANDGAELLRQLAAARGRGLAPTTILSDLRMPRQTGLEVLRRLRGQGLDTPFILMTGFGEDELAREAERLRAVVLQKPFWIDELLGALRRLGARPR